MKVTKTTVNRNRITSSIDLELDSLSDDKKEDAKDEVAQYLKEQTLKYLSGADTPVEGAPYKKKLSSVYAKEKRSDGLPPVPNLENSGDMLNALDVNITKNGLEIGIYGPDAPKADGHNNFSGESELPERRFLPKEGENYKSAIVKEVEKIIKDKIAEDANITRLTFATVRNKEEMWGTLRNLFPGQSRTSIVGMLLRSEYLIDLMDEFNVLRFLVDED